jgi:glycerol-3-phosphate acyltransferase PlsY
VLHLSVIGELVVNSVLYPALAAVAAYLVGSLSFAVIVSRVMGLSDPRTYGSKNPGATNVLRSGSKAAAVATLLLDALKGWFPVAAVQWWGQPYGLGEGTMALAGLGAFVGHMFPLYFRFAGGKGVATALGVLVATSGWLALATALTWLIVAYAFRYSSLAALVAALFAPAYYALGDGVAWVTYSSLLQSTSIMCILLIWRHSENIGRLLNGTESKIGKKKDSAATAPSNSKP